MAVKTKNNIEDKEPNTKAPKKEAVTQTPKDNKEMVKKVVTEASNKSKTPAPKKSPYDEWMDKKGNRLITDGFSMHSIIARACKDAGKNRMNVKGKDLTEKLKSVFEK